MDAKRQEQQRVGYIVSQGAQLAQRGAVPCGMSDILRGPTDMPGGTTGAAYPAEIRTEGKANPGDRMRRVWRELGQGDLARRRMGIPP